MNTNYPDFYIIGAPKSGTTSLFSYLTQHPQVFMPAIKEPQYFCSDLPHIMQVKSEKVYLDLFSKSKPGQLRGEASVWYLFSDVAVRNILNVRPDAKFIVMLREPVAAVQSYHNHAVLSLVEQRTVLADAWKNQIRKTDPAETRSRVEYPVHAYGDLYSYHEQLKRLYAAAPKDNIKVILFEDFVRSPKSLFAEVQSFLGLPEITLRSYDTFNSARMWKSTWVARHLVRPAQWIRQALPVTKHIANSFGVRPIEFLQRWFAVERKITNMSPATLDVLQSAFSEQARLLQAGFGLDTVRKWEVPPAASQRPHRAAAWAPLTRRKGASSLHPVQA